jgi:hypothetical protein
MLFKRGLAAEDWIFVLGEYTDLIKCDECVIVKKKLDKWRTDTE